MTWPFTRQLHAQLTRLREQSTSQQDEIRHLKHLLAQAEEDRASAMAGQSRAWEQIANWLAQRSGLGAISMKPEELPETPHVETPPVERKPLGRDVVNSAAAQFNQDLAEYVTSQMTKEEGNGNPQ